jgi:ribonuclease P protein component
MESLQAIMSDSEDASDFAPQPDKGFPSHVRLRTQSEFRNVYDNGRRVGDEHLLIVGTRSDLSWTRIGLSVSKRHGCAVVRNSKKRRLREAFRSMRDELPPGLDLVLIPRFRGDSDVVAYRSSLQKLVPRLLRQLSRRRSSARPSGNRDSREKQ